MKKCKIYTVPGSTHTGFFLTTNHNILHLCNEVRVDFTSLLIYKFCFKVLTLFKKEKIKRKGGRIFFFFYNKHVICPNLLLPLPWVFYNKRMSCVPISSFLFLEFFTTNVCLASQSPSSSSFSATHSSSFIETSDFKRCSWNLTYSSTLGVPLGVAPFFFCSRFWTFRDFTTFILTSKTSWMAFRKQWKL